ncbi:MAG: DoxX family membrane protein [Arachnia sp.]
MTSGANGEWVRQGTPRDDNADWNDEQSDYGTALSPTEWDDYSSEQSVPVAAPSAQVPEGISTAGSPGTPSQEDPHPVPGQEPDAVEEYRSEEIDAGVFADPVGDPADDGLDPAPIEPGFADGTDGASLSGASVYSATDDHDVASEPFETSTEETSRPRPIVPDASMAAVGVAQPVSPEPLDDDEGPTTPEYMVEASADDADAMDTAEYVAVDPVPAAETHEDEPTVSDETRVSPVTGISPDTEEDVMEMDGQSEDAATDVTDEQAETDADDDMEATQAVPVTVVAPDAAATGFVPDGLYRGETAEPTAVIAEETYPDVDVEEERQQARLEAERQAREQRLGAVATSSENATREDNGPARVTTDRFLPSFSLFVLRLVTASILGVTSWQILGSGVDATANYLGGFPVIPEPRLVAWILGFTLGSLALLLVIGLLQRFVGLVLLIVAVAALTFIRWGSFSIFNADTAGFLGDKDLLLAAIGLLLLGMGGGRWGIDGAFRASRAAAKAEREG